MAGRDSADRLARAWALKAECYAAWSSDPPRALQAAQALRALCTPEAPAPVRALADWTEGIACLIRGEMAEALGWLDRASSAWAALGDALHAARAQVPQVMALAVLGRFDEAQACALRAEAALHAQGDEHAAAKVRLNLGSLAFSRDQHGEAADHYRAAAVRFARAGDHEHSVMADIGMADALSYLGRFDAAGGHYRRARLRADHHRLPVLAASADHGLALLALAQGRYPDALAGLEATRRAYTTLALEHRRTEAEKNLADAYLELRLLPEAIALYTPLVHTLSSQDAGATLPWAQVQLARALALGGQPGAALQRLAEAAQGFEQQDNAAGRATVCAVQAELRGAAGQFQAALALALQAQAGFAAAGLPAHAAAARVQAAAAHTGSGSADQALADCRSLLADVQVPPQVGTRARVELARALLALQRTDEGRDALEAAIDALEDQRAALPGDDLRRAFLADASWPYRQRLQLALDEAEAQPDGAAQVLHWLERFKARALHDRLGRGGEPAAPDAALAPLRARLDWIYRRQQRLVEDEAEAAPQALRDEAVRLEQQLLETARRNRLLQALPGTAPPAAAGLGLAGLQAALGPGRALVEYGVAGDELFALVLRSDSARLHRRLASWAATQQALLGLRFQLDALRAGTAVRPEHLPLLCERAQRRLAQLHALVWQPLAGEVADCPRLVIVPHGELHAVPFAALGDAGGALVDRHDLVLAFSAAVARQGLHDDAGRGPLQKPMLVGDGTRLAHVSAELAAVGAALGLAPGSLTAPLGLAALQDAAPQADLLHLACHAQFRADSPLFSALHLADGALTAEQVQGLRLRARLVVLSACESALGETGVADEGVGLVRAFLMAGARRVLGSLWAVDDAATCEFMALFYAPWVAGEPAAAALAQAQRAMRARRPHPAHWAAFALHGAA